MKKFIDVLFDEDKSFEFRWWVPAIVLPIVLVALMCLAGWMDTLR